MKKQSITLLVKPDVYWTQILAAETVPPERIPLDIQWLLTLRVINPYKALFKAPPNWIETILARFNAIARGWIATRTLDDILEIHKEAGKLYQEFKEFPLFKTIEDEWGVKLEGIEIRDVKLPPAYAEAAARRKQLELEAEAKRERYKVEAEARAAEIMGSVIEAVAIATGLSKEQVQEEFKRDPEAFYRKHKTIIDNVMTKLSMEEREHT